MVSAALYDTEVDLGFYRPDNSWVSCYTGNVQLTGAGGSSEGVIATQLTQNASWKLPLILKPASAGCKLQVRFKLGTSDGVDKSDGIFILPITIKDLKTGLKSIKILKNTDFGTATDLPAGSITGTWYDFGATGYVINAGQEVCFGSSPSQPSFLSIENDA